MRIARLLGLSLLLLAACDGESPTSDAGGRPDAAAEDAATPSLDAGGDAGVPSTDASTSDAALADAAVSDGGADAGTPALDLDALVARLEDPSATEGALDALIHEVAWGPGWPATDGSRWLFATRWDEARGTVSLVGDVVGWTPGVVVAETTATGVHYWAWVEEADFVVPAAGAKYKWHATAGDRYREPTEATAYGSDDFGPFGYVAPPTDARWRERFPAFRSAHLTDPRAFRALLPAGFVPGSAAASRARTLFLHDGQNVFDTAAPFGGWRVHEALDGTAGFADVVVLAVDNAPDRMSAYTHVPDDIGRGPIGGLADDYLDLVDEEALPFFRARYGVSADGDSLAMGGSSLGGLVTLYATLTRPAWFGCAIAMSSTLGWGAFGSDVAPDALLRRWDARGTTAIYLDSGGSGTCSDGDGDGIHEDADDSDNLCVTNQLRDRLDELGYEFDVDLVHWWEPGATHDELAWAARMPRALEACAGAGWVVPD